MEKVMQQVENPLATFTRPTDTTPYADGDVIAASTSAAVPLKFPNACGEGAGGVIRNALLASSALPATKLSADLWLFDAAPENAYGNDNEAFALNDADVSKVVAVIALDGTVAANIKVSTLNYVVVAQSMAAAFRKPSITSQTKREDKTLYGVLVARNAYTPANAEVFNLKLGLERA